MNNPKACTIGNSSNQEHAHAVVRLRSERQVDNHTAELEADHAEPEANHAKPEADDVQIKCTCKYTSRMQYNGGASARSIPQGVVFLKASLDLK
jgi:hypothetical protein